MTLDILTAFFGWCTVLNGGLLLVSFLFIVIAKDFVLKVHGLFFSLSKDEFDLTMYKFFAYYKVAIIVFNIVPYVALRIIS